MKYGLARADGEVPTRAEGPLPSRSHFPGGRAGAAQALVSPSPLFNLRRTGPPQHRRPRWTGRARLAAQAGQGQQGLQAALL